jgi:SAM-dependent methyltransferase
MKRSAPAALRNRVPLEEVLRGVLPAQGLVLEVASGTGEHAAWFAQAFPSLTFQPSDVDAEARASIDAWAVGHANVKPALALDAAEPWPIAHADAVLCVNMVHIAPWAACLGLLDGAARALAPGAPLILYGPYRRRGVETAPSNEAFDASLRARNDAWGLRDLDEVVACALERGLALDAVVEMPANNITAVFRAEGTRHRQ